MEFMVKKIEEDVYVGCEEREVIMAIVTLTDEQGNERIIRHPDQLLYDRNINEGDRVYLDENDGFLHH